MFDLFTLHRVVRLGRSRAATIALGLTLVMAASVAHAAQLQLLWVDSSGGSAGFRIERKADAEPDYSEVALQAPGASTYTDGTVAPGTTYCYRVQAYNEAGASDYSNEACGTSATGLVIAINRGGTGRGLVQSTPAGIDCGEDCTETYGGGTLVTLAASPEPGSTFEGWSGGGCAGADPCTVTGNAPVTVAATFAVMPPTSYALTVTKAGPGTVTSGPNGIDCGADCAESYPAGTVVTLSATPSNGARFVGWTGGGCTGTGGCSVTLGQNIAVTATFTRSKGKSEARQNSSP